MNLNKGIIIMNVTTISTFRKSMAKFIDDSIINCEPLLVTTNDKPVIVLGKDYFDSMVDEIKRCLGDRVF